MPAGAPLVHAGPATWSQCEARGPSSDAGACAPPPPAIPCRAPPLGPRLARTQVELGFQLSFQPSFGVQRAGSEGTLDGDTVRRRTRLAVLRYAAV